MKRIICILLTALMVLGMLVGCQKTPEAPLYISKYEGLLAEQASQSDPVTSKAADEIDLYERLGAPKVYTSQLKSKLGRLTVDANAVVSLPKQEMPIIRIHTTDFSMDQVKAYADVLFGSDAVYTDGTDTKGCYQRQVEKLKDAIENWDSYGNLMYDLKYYTLDEAREGLAELEETANKAPVAPPAITPDFTWQKPRSWTDEGEVESTDVYILLYTMPNDSVISRFNASTNRQFGNTGELWYLRDSLNPLFGVDNNTDDISSMISITEEQAQASATDLIRRLGLGDFVCTGKQANDVFGYYKDYPDTLPVYSFYFTRSIDGIPETFTNDTVSSNDGTENPWSYERICVKVDGEGIAYFRYDNPMQIGEAMTESATLMPFADIQAIFEKMVLIVDNYADSGIWGESTQEYHITDVRLGLMSVRDNAKDTGLLIPVWDFLGYTTTYVASQNYTYDSDTNGYKSFLTINAVDGSIIQRGFGR